MLSETDPIISPRNLIELMDFEYSVKEHIFWRIVLFNRDMDFTNIRHEVNHSIENFLASINWSYIYARPNS